MQIPSIKTAVMTFTSSEMFGYCVLACVALAGALYIWQVNVSSTQGYAIADLNQEIEEIQHENEQLQHQVSSLQSVDSVTTRVQMLGLVKASDIHYLNPNDAMAVNR
ncbi:MAG: septum formation initiator family protein [Patescibacteria group bacterium]